MLLSPKQTEFVREGHHRWNFKGGATRSGKTYLDFRWIIPIRIRERVGKDGLTVILGVTKSTIERNVLEPMRTIYGDALVGTISSDNTAWIFGGKCYCLGAEKVSQVSKIRGASIKYCYGDEVADWSQEVFELLKSRLDKVSSFHASFTQKVTDGSGAAVQEGQGDLWVKRPNLFNWHMTQPDESILVSDGKTLWFYNPFVEQATATWLKDATGNTPFMLIARNQSSDWQQYNIKQNGDDFVLTPKASNGNLKQFTINVGRDGTIHQFSAVEQDDQRSSYQLKSQQNGAVDAAKFTFTPPQGVTVDDQRK